MCAVVLDYKSHAEPRDNDDGLGGTTRRGSETSLSYTCGMALEMNRLTPIEKASDEYEKKSFGLLMVAFSVFIVITALAAIVITIPCLRDRIVKSYQSSNPFCFFHYTNPFV